MTEQIFIDKAEVLDRVAVTTGYAGAKSADVAMYDRVAVIPPDREILTRFWTEAVGEVVHAMRRLLDDVEGTDRGVALTLRLSASADPASAASLADDLKNYIEGAIVARWMEIASPVDAPRHAAAARAKLDNAVRKAYTKRSPARPRSARPTHK